MTTRRKNSPNLWPLAALVLLATSGVLLLGATADTAPRPRYPQEDMGADSLPARKKAQLEAARQFKIFHDFQFVERLPESGITFRHHAVDEAGKHMRMRRYDHGCAVAVAKVDGDGSALQPVLRYLRS